MFHKVIFFILKWVQWVLIPILLFILAILLTSLFNPNVSFTILTYNHSAYDLVKPKFTELHKGDALHGSFKAEGNNLGIIAVRFNTFNRINTDFLQFSLKEKNNPHILYQHPYKVDQFQPNRLFTFGFPEVSDSKGKVYEFTITSLHGKKHNAVALSNGYPVFATRYHFSKKGLLSNKKGLILYTGIKTLNTISNMDLISPTLPYIYPFIIYIFWLILIVFRPRGSSPFILVAFIVIFFDVFYFSGYDSNNILILGLGIWIFLITGYLFESRVSFLAGIICILFYPVVLVFSKMSADRMGLWAYIFFMIGFMQVILEYMIKPKTVTRYSDIIEDMKFYSKIFMKKNAKLK